MKNVYTKIDTRHLYSYSKSILLSEILFRNVSSGMLSRYKAPILNNSIDIKLHKE